MMLCTRNKEHQQDGIRLKSEETVVVAVRTVVVNSSSIQSCKKCSLEQTCTKV